jgi:hypothetical protein
MRKQCLLVVMIGSALIAGAQSLSPEVVSTTGNFTSSAGGSISSTVGEPVVTTLSSASHTVTQGFQQPNDIVSGLLDREKEASGAFSVYPIPATRELWFGYELPEGCTVDVSVYDALGRKMDFRFTEEYVSGKSIHSLDCNLYAAGHYMLSIVYITKDSQRNVMSKKFQIVQ